MFSLNKRSPITVLALFCCVAAVTSSEVGRLVQRGEAPYVVQIQYIPRMEVEEDGGFLCAATIISRKHVLTAAHCFPDKPKAKHYRAIIGQVDLNPIVSDEEGAHIKTRRLIRLFIHPDFVRGQLHHDVAVAKVNSEVGFGAYTQKVGLCKQPPQVGENMAVYGWGRTAYDAVRDHVNELQEVLVSTLPKEKCVGQLDDGMFCAAGSDGLRCAADSGAAAIRDGELCGFVVHGEGCDENTGPAVFTEISKFQKFIEESMDDGMYE